MHFGPPPQQHTQNKPPKFRTGRYMGIARKQLTFDRERFPSITFFICNSTDANTWVHGILKCNHHHIHAIRIKNHNKAGWELWKLIFSTQKSRCYALIKAGSFSKISQENTKHQWLLPCTCEHQRCHYTARFKQDILYVKRLPYKNDPPSNIIDNLTIQFVYWVYILYRHISTRNNWK